jgi:hypothetical protein
MASQVLSGTSNPTYTNSTGQNVRLIINFMANCTAMTWAGVTISGTASTLVKGKIVNTFPLEIILASTQSFSATSGAYNIVVVREDGN